MFKFSTSTLSIGKIWENSFALYKQTILKVWYIPFIAAILLNLSSLWFRNIFYYQLPALILALYLLTVALHYIFALATDPASKIGNSLRVGLTKLLNIILACLILFLEFFIISFITGFLAAFIISFLALQTITAIAIVSLVFKTLMIASLIYIAILCAFTVPNILFENNNFFKAIINSIGLVWKKWWRTFAVLLLPALLTYTVLLILQIFVVNALPNILLGSICLAILLPLVKCVVLVQFNDLNRR